MQIIIPGILVIVVLLVIVVQDFRSRSIHWVLLPVLFASSLIFGWNNNGIQVSIMNFMFNIGFLVVLFALLSIYFSVKLRKPVNITNRYIGLGDILFYPAFCLLFSPLNFVVFNTVALMVVLVVYLLKQYLSKGANKFIPLAGGISIALIVVIILQLVDTGFSMGDNSLIVDLLHDIYE